jgi:hypothetical protein
LDDPRWRGVWFYDFNRTKLENFLGKMSVYGGEQIGDEPDSGTNGGVIEPKPEDNTPDDTQRRGRVDSPYNDVILRFPSILYESSIDHMTYFCMQQGSSSFKSRADYPYTKDKINVEITYPWNGQKVKVLYDPVYEGQSTLAYFRDRMGYRLVLREAYANRSVAQNDTLKFEGKIQNVGWNDVFNKKAVKVILKSKSGGFVSNAVLTNIDPYDWHPAAAGPHGEMPDSTANNKGAFRDLSFNIPMSAFGNVPVGKYDIYLKINDPKETTVNKRSIRFANKGDGIWNEDLGANLIGSTTVRDNSSVTQVNAAIAANLVPQNLQSKYSQATTRAEFCALAVALYENVTGKTITDRKTFDDTSDINVEKAGAIGVVSGMGNNKFSPNNLLTREQAATILSAVARLGAIGFWQMTGTWCFAASSTRGAWPSISVMMSTKSSCSF